MAADAVELEKLYPLDSLRPETRAQLAADAIVTEHGRGEILFRAGDLDGETLYLLTGAVTATYPDGKTKSVEAESLQGRYPVGDSQPRRYNAMIQSPSARILRLDRRYTEKVVAWDQLTRNGTVMSLDPAPGRNRWVFQLLQSRAFRKLPTGNIERMFQAFEERIVRAGEAVVREGEDGDYFYVIKEGTAAVSRMAGGADTVMAYLGRGDCFGEDALLASTTRNATVRMIEEGCLMRLSRRVFLEILKPPSVEWQTPAQASLQAQNGARIVDVRTEAEFAQRNIKDAINLPLYRLREQASEQLAPGSKVIVYCNTGERSAAAAFILTRQGYEVSAIQGGLAGMLRQIERRAG